NDIAKIEIISGPGSVTYGPGAITSVISITTKNGESSPGVKAGVQYISSYDSKLAYASYGVKKADFNAYVYGSYTATEGGTDGEMFTTNSTTGVAGYQPKDAAFTKIYGDNLDKPQLKGYVELNYKNNWSLRTRYTNSGTNSFVSNGTFIKDFKDGAHPARFTGQEGFLTDLQNNLKISDKLKLVSNLSYDVEHHYDYSFANANKDYNQDNYNGTTPVNGNIIYDFQEKEIAFNTVANYELEKFKIALGYSFSHDIVDQSPGVDTVYMQYNSTKMTNGTPFINEMYNGWSCNTHSVYGEIYVTLHPFANFLLSGRYDKNTFSEDMISPRIAYIAEINPKNTFKLIWQQSVRMPALEDLKKGDLNHQVGKAEVIKVYEAQYVTLPIDRLKGTLDFYYSDADLRGWGGEEVIYLGNLKHWGATIDLQYKDSKSIVGLSHAHTKQIDFKSFDNTKRQGISVSDYNVKGLQSVGNDLSNWCNDITKVYATVDVYKGLKAHADAQIFWKWQGMLNVIESYDNKFEADPTAKTTPTSATNPTSRYDTWKIEKATLEDENVGGTDVRLNLSLSYKLPIQKSVEFTVFGSNLLEAKRYVYNSGEEKVFPDRMNFYQEPRIFGVKVNIGL
ncbi:MAG: TonB-dependent receptor, partial [Erysipelotrichaceae bacterium]|nr:TonB-dependent receptor [Erysipelotrichaceae bacterium]